MAWLPEFGCTLAKPQSNSRVDALDRQLLGDVDELAAAVIAPARIALGIFVGQNRALRLEHRLRDDVFGGDELDLVALAAKLLRDRLGDFRIGFGEAAAKKDIRRVTWDRQRIGHETRNILGTNCGMPESGSLARIRAKQRGLCP